MKRYFPFAPVLLCFVLLCSHETLAQDVPDSAHIVIDSTDARPRNAYGDLLDDDKTYNRRYHWVIPFLRVTSANLTTWARLRFLNKAEYTYVNLDTWKYNLKHGWEWDNDDFGTNFLSHPYSGAQYFNAARSNGYGHWASYPYAIIGSVEWEWFAENTRPSKNDLINTPVSGAFLGEVLYRLSSNILDERKRGPNRVWREILAAVVNPTRAFNRFTQGKMKRVTPVDVYQQEPLNITLGAGVHRVNENNRFGSGATNAILNLQFDYGDPFEVRRRKPFDVFRLRIEGRYGDDKRLIDNVLGYGVLFGRTIKKDRQGILLGIFQQYDYWNNKVFELGSLGFGPGIIAKLGLGRTSDLYSGFHLAAVPIAGNSTRVGPDSSEFRDYPFGGGAEARIEERFNFGKIFSLGFNGYYYWIWNYEGPEGKSRIGILKPFLTVRLYKGLSLGFEHHVYYDNRFIDKLEALHVTTTEQKVFLQYFFQDTRRYGRYH
ncbi:MAG TPA: DUF3943 domain-containing protein [Chitinophagaceae bacterium]|nr:DUF3943 domain-containing protein [Chitinophagaceae bacterium]